MGFAKRPRDIVSEMTVKELREMIRNLRIICPSGSRKAVMVALIVRHSRPEVIRTNYRQQQTKMGYGACTPRQNRRIRKANNRARGICKS